MYFEIENTPEHIRRARKTEQLPRKSPKEECPRLTLAPFSKTPQVVFENVTIGSCCERTLEVVNPSKQIQQITLGRSLPEGLVIPIPGEWLVLEPETCYELSLLWSPTQPTALRNTIRFTNENRGKFDVIVVLKTGMALKIKSSQSKKISPGKIKKKPTKKSPIAIYKKKGEIIYNTTKIKKTVNVVQSTHSRVLQPLNRDNILSDYSLHSQMNKCPFDSPTSFDFNFDTSEVFSNMRKINLEKALEDTYDKSYRIPQHQNTLKSSNQQAWNVSGSDMFDNLTFTPLKSLPAKKEKLDNGPQIIASMNSESDFDDSLDTKQSNKENETHSVTSITSSQPPNIWSTVNHQTQHDNQYNKVETSTIQSKKIPNTSSPKELTSPNFSINTDFSRISELSFLPHRFSTERKGLLKFHNDTHDLIEDAKLSSDTYTKDSPQTPVDFQMYTFESRPPHYFSRELQPKMCKQALFNDLQQKELKEKNYMGLYEHNNLQRDHKFDVKSPPRSVSPPPLQSIPEETIQFSETDILDRTDKQMSTFTINRTFDKGFGSRSSISTINKQSWSKKAPRVEPELWKVPASVPARKSIKPKQRLNGKDSLGGKLSVSHFDANNTTSQNMSIINHIGNVYSQSSTLDPFLSSTYFYDEEAVDKFEKEFKRWLNCVLTPPADLDSNIEQKIDVGKAWLQNRNKEVPLAPTKEQVCSVYHNSHRLESLRKSARNLLISPEIMQVFQKLNAQIDKKLIAIRTDRNLHLDVGLQKVIMELLLSYNPLWLRLGLEAIYGLVLPLKSNSDIEGLTTFIIQRMFKNPHLKNKHSKSNAPNILLPAYMEAVKKFTLKKFFMLVFFLDQAKQKKLISHDPCLFCRNAICKESREILIRFTRELIAGIGDITRHLRPLGYVVCHKQSYLDEYKYAVHNIAVDIRDGVRLTKVMEIILMKNGLLHQLRTPAISRLQKIHNVQVALNALKDVNFVIVGDITANDIADGHREKTLSLLWQLIHVFRAPLFEQAANVIQIWWRKKFEVIVEKRKAATKIQRWWRCVQYNRLVEWKMQQVTTATIMIQKYCRMWLCRSQYQRMKTGVLKIEEWYRSIGKIREARKLLAGLKLEREILQRKSATVIQKNVRRLLCVKRYKLTLKKIVLIQSLVRRFLLRKRYYLLIKYTTIIQQKFRSKTLMKAEMLALEKKRKIIMIQTIMREREQRRLYIELKREQAALTIQRKYRARCLMMLERTKYLIILNACIKIQRAYRAYTKSKLQRQNYLEMKSAAVKIQRHYRYITASRRIRMDFIRLRNTAIVIQRRYRFITKAREVRRDQAARKIQIWYRSVLERNKCRRSFLQLKASVSAIQSTYRMYSLRKRFLSVKQATVTIQRYYRSYKVSSSLRHEYLHTRSAIIQIQTFVRCHIARMRYLKMKRAVLIIQAAFRFKKQKDLNARRAAAAICLQKYARRYIVQSQYQRYRKAVVCIQKIWKGKLVTRLLRCEFLQKRNIIIQLQSAIRGYLVRKQVQLKRENLLKIKEEKRQYWAASKIQALFRGHLVRVHVTADRRVAEIRRRWREGALESTQESLKERNEEAMQVLRNMSDIETVIRAFQSLELLTEVFPMMYHDNASGIVRRVYIYMSVTNRSISSIEVLKSASSVLVNLTRYRVTGPRIYARDRISPILKFMWRFSNSETHLFCILATYIWLFSKYDEVRQDLTEFLHIPSNHKMLATIKGNVVRMKRMATNIRGKFNTPQPSKFVSHTGNQSLNLNLCNTSSHNSCLLPALEPDYGIVRADKPRYFEDAQQAINCLFKTYKL